MKVKYHEDQFVKISIEGEFIIGVFKDGSIDKNTAMHAVQCRLNLSKGKKMPLLIKGPKVFEANKEARDLLASSYGCQGLTAIAIIINSKVGKVIANFYLQLSKPIVPTQIFTDETKARKWLQQFVENEVPQER